MARGGKYDHDERQSGDLLTPEIYNRDHQQHIDNLYPEKIDDFSDDDEMFQADEFDPYKNGAINLPNSLAQELEALRFQLKGLIGKAQWYLPPATSVASLNTAVEAVPANFVSTSAPSSASGSTGSIWIRLNGTTIEVYQRSATGWPASPQVSLSAAVQTNVSLTGGSADPTGGRNGDVYLQLAGDSVALWRNVSGTWTRTLTYDGIAVTAGSAAPSGGDTGDVYIRLTGTTLSVHKKGASAWTQQATATIPQITHYVGTTVPASGLGSNGNTYAQFETNSIKYYVKESGSWALKSTVNSAVAGGSISDQSISTFDFDDDYLTFMDASIAKTPDRRTKFPTVPISKGGTGQTSLAGLRTSLGVLQAEYITQTAYDALTNKVSTKLYFIPEPDD